MEVKLKKTGTFLSVTEHIPVLNSEGYEETFDELIDDGKSFLGTNPYFENCLFQVSDLKVIIEQTDCHYLVFSHLHVEEDSGTKHSTALVFGANSDRVFLWKSGEIYFSVDINRPLDFAALGSFNQDSNLQWHLDATLDERQWSPTAHAHFETWLTQFDAKATMTSSTGHADLLRGIYYEVDQLREAGLLDENTHSQIALFPSTMSTRKANDGPPIMHVVSYVLAPVSGTGKVSYQNNNKD